MYVKLIKLQSLNFLLSKKTKISIVPSVNFDRKSRQRLNEVTSKPNWASRKTLNSRGKPVIFDWKIGWGNYVGANLSAEVHLSIENLFPKLQLSLIDCTKVLHSSQPVMSRTVLRIKGEYFSVTFMTSIVTPRKEYTAFFRTSTVSWMPWSTYDKGAGLQLKLWRIEECHPFQPGKRGKERNLMMMFLQKNTFVL